MSRGAHRRAIGAVLIVLALTAVTVGVTFAAFSGTTSTPVSSFSATADFNAGTLRVETGGYTGNAVPGRAISVGFQPDVVIVKAARNRIGVLRTSSMVGDLSKSLSGATALASGSIPLLTATGFTLGTAPLTNQNNTAYTWTAFRANPGVLTVGTYIGNGTSQTVAGLGFSPEYVAVASAGTGRAVQHASGMTSSFQFDSNTGAAGRVSGLTADGFTVGNSADTNALGIVYHYVALNEIAGAIDVASYTGDATNDRSVTGVGFSPLWVNVRANDTVTARNAQHRSTATTGTASQFFDATADLTGTGIRAFLADGYRLGTDASVNAAGVTYYHLAVRNTAP